MNNFGKNFRLSIFGESHGTAIGIVIDGLKAGIKIDFDEVKKELKRRAPANFSDNFTTNRKEDDDFEILSGIFNEYTNGAPLCVIFKNKDKKSIDYEMNKFLLRPSHADYTAFIKYNFFNDYRGGGHFSGRITAPLVFAGAIAKQILKEKGIDFFSHIKKFLNYYDETFFKSDISLEELKQLKNEKIPLLDKKIEKNIQKELENIAKLGDSVGAIIETMAINLPSGLGEPFFSSIESELSRLIFSIPAIKGIEFGLGFDFSNYLGSFVNDEYKIENEKIRTKTNYNGGILGGISNGENLIFSCVVKPTPSIRKKQRTVNIETKKECDLEIKGRHDSFIALRVIPVIEAVTAIVILDLILENNIKSY